MTDWTMLLSFASDTMLTNFRTAMVIAHSFWQPQVMHYWALAIIYAFGGQIAKCEGHSDMCRCYRSVAAVYLMVGLSHLDG
ncbi:hypothetical protein [Bradyrhizobium stylosanthis]|uniref:hypothetical protein n=1 Tax=Bradyrhizobium stylosanthis TaxID=1803665 RepID=UPI000AC07CDB|nr:hypothetical protein [Bradyrhizobium stylosanthis]